MKKTARPIAFASFRKKAEATAKKERAVQAETDRSEAELDLKPIYDEGTLRYQSELDRTSYCAFCASEISVGGPSVGLPLSQVVFS
jgi:hypothetical protein